jgi:hypothetical protein
MKLLLSHDLMSFLRRNFFTVACLRRSAKTSTACSWACPRAAGKQRIALMLGLGLGLVVLVLVLLVLLVSPMGVSKCS